ncbi:MAG: hypothetical protein HKN82_06005, partial [Akkermansiaceae bacterium]|nr:hypothetical protein [Akkermansiaceae bacterium]
MQVLRTVVLAALPLTACSQLPDPGRAPAGERAAPPREVPVAAPAGVNLTASQKRAIGRKIWQNESSGTIKGLTHWNEGEEFPSMGIGHFIWYPKGFNGRWTETFPEFIRFARARGVGNIPAVAMLPDCPWNSRAAFYRDFEGERLRGLRNWLANSIDLQTDFIMFKSRAALPEIMAAAPAAERARIKANYEKVATTPNGVYALIDYVNFKGAGTNPREQYKGQGWGLMWALMEMRDVPAGAAAATEFGRATFRCLDRRIANSPPARGEKRWREGWRNRCYG